jgi:hypothetical protein
MQNRNGRGERNLASDDKPIVPDVGLKFAFTRNYSTGTKWVSN